MESCPEKRALMASICQKSSLSSSVGGLIRLVTLLGTAVESHWKLNYGWVNYKTLL